MKYARSYCHIIPPVWTVRHPDMAAGWLTEFVRQRGWDVQLLDLNAELYDRETRPLVKDCWERLFVAMDPYAFSQAIMEQHDEYIGGRIQQALDSGCRIFGMLLLDGSARLAARVSRMIKQRAPDAHVVVGGTGSTSLYRLRRRYGDSPPMGHPVDKEMEEGHAIDSWVLGEGEHTLLELLTRLEQGEDLHGVNGLVLTEDGPFAKFKERALIKDLSTLPHATFEGFDMDRYHFRALPFQLSRGCVFARCSHCGLKGYSRGFRVRPPEHAVAEIKYNMERHKVRIFHFTDLGVNGDLEKLEAFCDGVIDNKLDIEWQSFVQIRGDMTPTLLEKVVRSGCTSLNYGFESGSDEVLGRMCKPYNTEEAAAVLRMTTEAGGKAIINIMCGHPGETEQEFQKTLDFLTHNAENIHMVASVGFTGIHIHSPLLDQAETYGVVPDEHGSWTSADGVIDRQLRNERVHRVAEHLRMEGIPCFEAFWESDRGQQEDHAPALSSSSRTLHISALQVSGPDGVTDKPLDAEEPVIIRVGYAASEGVERAVFDLKITDLEGNTVLATPATTETVREVALGSEGWVQMVLAAHDLSPGQYIVSSRVHPLHSEGIYDHFILRTPVEVMGVARQSLQVQTPFTWTHQQGHLSSSSPSPVVMVRIRDGYGVESHAVLAGQPMTVVVGLASRPDARGTLQFRVLTVEQECAHESTVKEVDLNEPVVCRWSLDGLDVAPGTYQLEMLLTTAEEKFLSLHHLSAREAGADQDYGLAYLAPWEKWRVLLSAPETPERPELLTVEVVRQDGEEGPLIPGTILVAQMTIAGFSRGLAGLHCRTWITNEDGMVGVATATAQVVSPSGAVRLDQHLQLNMLEGTYHMHCALWDLAKDCPHEPVWSFPLVIGALGRQAGGGKVYSPHSMRVVDA